jgi:hypothetical protein
MTEFEGDVELTVADLVQRTGTPFMPTALESVTCGISS